MSDPIVFLDFDIVEDKRPLTHSGKMVPYRAFDLVEFYKLVKEKNVIDAISIDIENHTVSFIIGDLVQKTEVTET